ncbi:MAG: amidohydrolase, partial [Firmicutes bacterium]|nr:amidohydrolase [Bacillota bacterium]
MTTQFIIDSVDAHQEEITDLAKKIWENPEPGWKETQAVCWTAEVLEQNGFCVEQGAYRMPTA